MITNILLLLFGVLLLLSNSGNKKELTHTCNRCGEKYIGDTCLKCGYKGYASESVSATPLKSIIGFMLIFASTLSLPYVLYFQNKDKIDNKFTNMIVNTITNIVEIDNTSDDDNQTDYPFENTNKVVPNKDVTTNNNVTTNNTNENKTNTKPSSNTTKPDNKDKYSITTIVKNPKASSCTIKSINASVTSLGEQNVEITYNNGLTPFFLFYSH